MAAVIPEGTVAWGLQLPVQSQSTIFVQPWESAAGPTELAAIARSADRAGAFYVGVCDHVAIPTPSDQAMGTVWYDTIATLGWLGALTESVHLLSHVYVLPYRHPLMVAKAFSTLDALSGGRAILGAGAGHVEAEFETLGVEFASRGSAVEESLPVIRSAFESEYVDVDVDVDGSSKRVAVAPRPVRAGGPPIWVGGSSKAAIRRAALLGDGWLPQGPPKMGTSRAIGFIHETRYEAGLPAEFDIGMIAGPIFLGGGAGGSGSGDSGSGRTGSGSTGSGGSGPVGSGAVGSGQPDFDLPEHTMTGSPQEIAERLARLTSRGINQLQFRFLGRDAQQVCDQIEQFGAEVAPLLQGS